MKRLFRSIPLALTLLLASNSYTDNAKQSFFITDAYTSKVRIYNSDLDEIAQIKKKAFKKYFSLIEEQPADSKNKKGKKGLPITHWDDSEGMTMIAVNLPEHGAVLLEESSVEIWPPIRTVDCPEGITGESGEVSSGVSIGFGENCE